MNSYSTQITKFCHLTNYAFLFNSRYAALDAMQNKSKPDSFFEAKEVRGLPDTPSEYCMCTLYLGY